MEESAISVNSPEIWNPCRRLGLPQSSRNILIRKRSGTRLPSSLAASMICAPTLRCVSSHIWADEIMISAEQLVTAIGTRLDLVDVATEVKSRLSEIQQDIRSPATSHGLSQELARYEEDVSSQFAPGSYIPLILLACSSSMP
jgi:hypothetical protein